MRFIITGCDLKTAFAIVCLRINIAFGLSPLAYRLWLSAFGLSPSAYRLRLTAFGLSPSAYRLQRLSQSRRLRHVAAEGGLEQKSYPLLRG